MKNKASSNVRHGEYRTTLGCVVRFSICAIRSDFASQKFCHPVGQIGDYFLDETIELSGPDDMWAQPATDKPT